jgi:hypothetical protein
LKITRDLANTFTSHLGSYSMAIFSSLNIDHLTYQYSNALSYFYISSLASTAPLQQITAQVANHIYGKVGEALSSVPGAIYPIYL